MKRPILYLILLLIPFLLIADYNPQQGTARIIFEVSNLNTANYVSFPADTNEDSFNYLEVVWNTGDTGKSLIIHSAGTYVCSVKDKLYMAVEAKWVTPVWIHGLPDTVIIDTFNVYNPQGNGVNIATVRQFRMRKRGNLVIETYRDTAWMYNDTTLRYTESHARYFGFWSGVIDSIAITQRSFPVLLNARVYVKNNKMIINRKWDATY
jgi:hypothetical protein